MGTPVLVLVSVNAMLLHALDGILKPTTGVLHVNTVTTCVEMFVPSGSVTPKDTVYVPLAEKVMTGADAVGLEKTTPAGTADHEYVSGVEEPEEVFTGIKLAVPGPLHKYCGIVKTELKSTPLYFHKPPIFGDTGSLKPPAQPLKLFAKSIHTY